MPKLIKAICLLSFLIISQFSFAQSYTSNKGKEFWIGYGHHQSMETSTQNFQNLSLYLSVDSLPSNVTYVTVTITIDSSASSVAQWWKRVYQIPANTVITLDNSATPATSFTPATTLAWGPLPKGNVDASNSNTAPGFDARLFTDSLPVGNSSEGLFRGKGIHIESDYPIVAYSHLYSALISSSSMLIPVSSWGTQYTTINSRQDGAPRSFSYFYVVASVDNTPIKIIPSQNSRTGNQAIVPINITLNKGQIFQYLGYATGNTGVQLTGSTIESLDSLKPIAVFAGSSRTSGENHGGCSASTADNDMQQCYPYEIWGKEFLTTPFSSATSTSVINPSIFAKSSYKIISKESNTFIRINSGNPMSLPIGTYYQFTNDSANKITSNKPVMVAQFMMSNNCSLNNLGDPEMTYLSPVSRGVKQVRFFRNTKEEIRVNYVSFIIPNNGLSTLQIDGLTAAPYGGNYHSYKHTRDTNYTVIVKGWLASRAQCSISSDKRIIGITYGIGPAESYAYNIGTNFYLSTPNINQPTKPIISGTVFCDLNNNGVKDANEFGRAHVKLQLQNGKTTFTDNNGYYEIETDQLGAQTLTIRPTNFFTAVPQSNNYNFLVSDTTVTQNFALQKTSTSDSILLNVIPFFSSPVASSSYPYFVEFQNLGTTTLSPIIRLFYDTSKLIFDSSSNVSVFSFTGYLWFSSPNMYPGEIRNFSSYFRVKSNAVSGDTIRTKYSYESNPKSQTDSFKVVISGSYIPNTQSGRPGISTQQITNGERIKYLINYENLSSYQINHLRIINTLSNNLDLNSIQIISSSKPCKAIIRNNVVLFEFLNANISDKQTNPFGRAGFIYFSVLPKSTLANGDSIINKANLYFDFEDVVNIIQSRTDVTSTGFPTPLDLISFQSRLLTNNTIINKWKTFNEKNISHFNVEKSFNGLEFSSVNKTHANNNLSNEYEYVDILNNSSNQEKVFYRLQILDLNGTISYSKTNQISLTNKSVLNIYPNPAEGSIVVELKGLNKIIITDYLGKILVLRTFNNTNQATININNLKSGLYVIQAQTILGEVITKKLQKK